jgi:hypothetical protein
MRSLATVLAVITTEMPALAAELKSGLQAGEKVPGPFHPLNVTGENKGEKHCLFCSNGNNPVAMVFARTAECAQTAKLIKAVDEATMKNKKANVGSFVVFLSDAEGLDKKLASMASKEKIESCVLSIDNPSGPAKYNVAKEADLTIVLYISRTVKVNYSFEKGKITDKDIEKVVADIGNMVK